MNCCCFHSFGQRSSVSLGYSDNVGARGCLGGALDWIRDRNRTLCKYTVHFCKFHILRLQAYVFEAVVSSLISNVKITTCKKLLMRHGLFLKFSFGMASNLVFQLLKSLCLWTAQIVAMKSSQLNEELFLSVFRIHTVMPLQPK